MIDPFLFAAAVTAALASFTTGTPPPDWSSAEYSTVQSVVVEIPAAPSTPPGPVVDINPLGTTWDTTTTREGNTYSHGWVTSPVSGRLVCVTAAPCEADTHYRGAIDSTWNWRTGEAN